MDIMEKAYDRACCETEDILQRQKFDKQDVEMFGAFIDIIKDIEMIFNYQDNMGGYSQMNGESFMRSHSNRMPMYGRYNHGSSYGRSSGYSRTSNKDEMLDRLQDVMDMAVDEKDRKAVSRLMEQMSQN